MKNNFAVANLLDFCLFILGVYCIPFFTNVKNFIATCDTEMFCAAGAVTAYVVITAIKSNNDSKH
jgi:hypothetical protein